MPCHGIRGATTADDNSPEAIISATRELLEQMTRANRVTPEEVAAALFSVTPDLNAAFPSQAARQMGWERVPLLNFQEISVPGSLPRCIRVLILWNTNRSQDQIAHVYLRQARSLRPDLSSETNPIQKETIMPPKVVFQGEYGAYSQEAIYQFFGQEAEAIPLRTFEAVFAAVDGGQADYGMLPVENTVAGSVVQAYDLLLEHDLRIWAEVVLRVHHCLLALPGTKLTDLRRVRSHPQALAQCQRFLARHNLEPEPFYDTAGAARELAEHPQADCGAIASRIAAETYGLEVLAADIEDVPWNYTRFFVLSDHDPPRAQRNKTSLVFAVRHVPGALHACLEEFAVRGINLTRIESRPRGNRPWHYIFYLDFEGHWQDQECEKALLGLLRKASFVKMLGSYPAAEEE